MKEKIAAQMLPKSEDMIGKTLEFPRTGHVYRLEEEGNFVRLNGQPWKSKAERKRYLRERRLARKDNE